MSDKSITLVELILSMVLLSVIVLAAVSFDHASRFLFQSSERTTLVLNDLTLILEHLAKYVSLATGDRGNYPAIEKLSGTRLRIRNDIRNTPDNYVDDIASEYTWDGSRNFTFTRSGSSTRLSGRVAAFSFSTPAVNQVRVETLTLRYDPTNPTVDPKTNPEVSLPSQITISSFSSSAN